MAVTLADALVRTADQLCQEAALPAGGVHWGWCLTEALDGCRPQESAKESKLANRREAEEQSFHMVPVLNQKALQSGERMTRSGHDRGAQIPSSSAPSSSPSPASSS
eukprot:1656084-Pyramimonas_sp.AAC.1